MTDKEIIKGLECCINWGITTSCADCPLCNTGCVHFSKLKETLDLINRQQAEIEELKKVVIDDYASEYDSKIRAEAIKEFAERLKLKIDIDLCEAIECSDYLYNLPKLIDNLIKEMVGEQE